MKKLMIAAAIVCAAAMSQASTVNWKQTDSKIYDGTGTTGYMPYSTTPVYLMLGDSADSIVKNMTASGYADVIKAAAADNTKKLNSQGKIDFKSDVASLAPDSASKAYYVIFNGNEMFVSDVKDLVWQDNLQEYSVAFANAKNPSRYNNTTTTFKKHNASSGGYVGAGWYTFSAVPEPTSGLLLLLGVAGLALRRRRA